MNKVFMDYFDFSLQKMRFSFFLNPLYSSKKSNDVVSKCSGIEFQSVIKIYRQESM